MNTEKFPYTLEKIEFGIEILKECRDSIYSKIMALPDASDPHKIAECIYAAFEEIVDKLSQNINQ